MSDRPVSRIEAYIFVVLFCYTLVARNFTHHLADTVIIISSCTITSRKTRVHYFLRFESTNENFCIQDVRTSRTTRFRRTTGRFLSLRKPFHTKHSRFFSENNHLFTAFLLAFLFLLFSELYSSFMYPRRSEPPITTRLQDHTVFRPRTLPTATRVSNPIIITLNYSGSFSLARPFDRYCTLRVVGTSSRIFFSPNKKYHRTTAAPVTPAVAALSSRCVLAPRPSARDNLYRYFSFFPRRVSNLETCYSPGKFETNIFFVRLHATI